MGFLDRLFNREPKPGKPRKLTDETFRDEVLSSGIPSVIDFWSLSCPPCQVMGGLLSEIGPDYAGRVNIFKLNVDRNPKITAMYQVQSLPTLIFLRGGRVVDRVVGLLPLNPLKRKLDRLAR